MTTLFLEAGSVSLFYQSSCKSKRTKIWFSLQALPSSCYLRYSLVLFLIKIDNLKQFQDISVFRRVSSQGVMYFFKMPFLHRELFSTLSFFITVSTFRIGRSVNKTKVFMYEETGNFYLLFSSWMLPVFGKVCTTDVRLLS